jgi:hypothetical protein
MIFMSGYFLHFLPTRRICNVQHHVHTTTTTARSFCERNDFSHGLINSLPFIWNTIGCELLRSTDKTPIQISNILSITKLTPNTPINLPDQKNKNLVCGKKFKLEFLRECIINITAVVGVSDSRYCDFETECATRYLHVHLIPTKSLHRRSGILFSRNDNMPHV